MLKPLALAYALCAGCHFTHGVAEAPDGDIRIADAAPDAQSDATVARRLCDPATGLLVCFSFDAPFASPLPDEAPAPVTAQLTNATWIARGSGGAAQIDTSSKIFVPPNAALTGFATIEMWWRIEINPADGTRIGVLDADTSPSAMSFFYYQMSSVLQLRFEIGQQLFIPYTVPLSTWIYTAEVCDAGTLTAYVDGVAIGTRTGCTPGDATPYGLMIGANNLQGGNSDSQLTGAIDGLRLWTIPRSASDICQDAGASGC